MSNLTETPLETLENLHTTPIPVSRRSSIWPMGKEVGSYKLTERVIDDRGAYLYKFVCACGASKLIRSSNLGKFNGFCKLCRATEAPETIKPTAEVYLMVTSERAVILNTRPTEIVEGAMYFQQGRDWFQRCHWEPTPIAAPPDEGIPTPLEGYKFLPAPEMVADFLAGRAQLGDRAKEEVFAWVNEKTNWEIEKQLSNFKLLNNKTWQQDGETFKYIYWNDGITTLKGEEPNRPKPLPRPKMFANVDFNEPEPTDEDYKIWHYQRYWRKMDTMSMAEQLHHCSECWEWNFLKKRAWMEYSRQEPDLAFSWFDDYWQEFIMLHDPQRSYTKTVKYVPTQELEKLWYDEAKAKFRAPVRLKSQLSTEPLIPPGERVRQAWLASKAKDLNPTANGPEEPIAAGSLEGDSLEGDSLEGDSLEGASVQSNNP